MSRYDENWERVVGAVLRREHDREVALLDSASTSFSSISVSLDFDELSLSFGREEENSENGRRNSTIDLSNSFSSSISEDHPVQTPARGFSYYQGSVNAKWFFKKLRGIRNDPSETFVATGVPKIQRSELETACEDFSNIIGFLSNGTVYKGTLSHGVEIAAISTTVMSAEDWSKKVEAQFRTTIDTLSKLNHRNFINLIAYSEEVEPFRRMMVFEYAPNGTLFEHLHVKDSEHLDWATRLRIAMGIGYCLEYMHHLRPPMALKNLLSSSIYLTEDYAAKLSDFSFWNEVTQAKTRSALVGPKSNVYKFGLILFEIITGRHPYSVGDGSVVNLRIMDYLRQGRPLREVVDPTLKSYNECQLEKLLQLAKECGKMLKVHNGCHNDCHNGHMARSCCSIKSDVIDRTTRSCHVSIMAIIMAPPMAV